MTTTTRLALIGLALTILGAGCYAKTTVTTGNTNTTVTTQVTTNNPGTGTFVTNTSATNTSVSVTAAAVSITDFAFTPSALTVKKGTVVTWTNNGQTTHQIASTGGPTTGSIAPGHTATYTFNTVGTFTYHCSIHPTMIGTITVIE